MLKWSIDVELADAGVRIDRYLAAQLPELSRSYLQKLIREGAVLVNEQTVRASYQIEADDQILLLIPDPVAPEVKAEDIPLEIVYEDADLLVVNKPQGMVVHPSAGHADGTLVNALLYHCQGGLSGINGILRPGIVHRIDRDTSGLLVVCKTDAAHRSLAEQFKDHNIDRSYQAICIGQLKEEQFTIEGNIGRHPRERKRMAVLTDGGKTAVTHIRLIENLSKGFAQIEARLETGRTHQIRVHMASKHHPILGDALYGPKKSPVPGLSGQVLHAQSLGFIHPTTGEHCQFTSELPDYFKDLLSRLS